MDSLAAAFSGSFQVTSDPNTTAAPHPRYSLYKTKGENFLQNKRRRRLLDIQKQCRFDAVAHARRLADDCWKGMDKEEEGEETEEMDVQVSAKKPGRHYRNQLMMSEWLVEIPDDFEEEWLMVLCPVAKRTLVVASHGKTVAYNKAGYRIRTFPSSLPGGCRHEQVRYGHYSILDCLFDEVAGTYWVLDLMCWKSMPIYETETEFRFYWLHQNLQESPELAVKRKRNPYSFQALPSFPCTPQAIEEALANATFEVDGLLFFHKRTSYTFGSTPLVVWLKPYMVQDVLNIPVPPHYLQQTPSTYIDYAHHIAQVKADKHGNEHRRPRNQSNPTSPNIKNSESNKSSDDKAQSPGCDAAQETAVGMDVIQGVEGGQVIEGGKGVVGGQGVEGGQGMDVVQGVDGGQVMDVVQGVEGGQVMEGVQRVKGGRGDGSRTFGSSMETAASAEEVSQREAQIHLLIRPTKFKLGDSIQCERLLAPSTGGGDASDVQSEQCTPIIHNLAGGEGEESSQIGGLEQGEGTSGDAMTVEPVECEVSQADSKALE